MQYEEYIVVIGIETGILVGLEDRISIELMETILRHHRIDLIEWRIDSVEPESGHRWIFGSSHLIFYCMVLRAGLEPASREAEDFETSVSTIPPSERTPR